MRTGARTVPVTEAALSRHDGAGAAARPIAHEVGRRLVPDRAGMTIFFAPQPDALRLVRTVEDLFALVAYRHGLASESRALDAARAAARDTPYLDAALRARVGLLPGSRAGRRLRFRVVARMSGQHEFRRVDLERAVERGVSDRHDHTWRLEQEQADVEFWATMIADELFLGMRLSDERMRHRGYKVAHRPGSLRPSVAAALGWLSQPGPDDIVLDPLCGVGTILIERAHLGRYRELIGGDSDREAIEAARTNIGPRYKPIELRLWDAAVLPLGDASVTRIITNLPWGIKYSSHAQNRRLYPRLFAEFRRVLSRDGLMVLLSGEFGLMREMIARQNLAVEQTLRVSILGARAAVYVCRPLP